MLIGMQEAVYGLSRTVTLGPSDIGVDIGIYVGIYVGIYIGIYISTYIHVCMCMYSYVFM